MPRSFAIPLLAVLLLLGAAPAMLMRLGQAHDPLRIDTGVRLSAPTPAQWFGTDELGCSVLGRACYAGGLSLQVAAMSLLVALALALLLGGLAGYWKGTWPDLIISWLIALLHTVPFFLIAVALAAILKPGIAGIYLIIGCVAWAAPARLVRAEFMQLRSARFVTAQKALGLAPPAIFLRSILPVAFLPALASLIYLVPEFLCLDVGLSFFGLGAQPPTPTLGRLIFNGLGRSQSAWWLGLFPALLLLLSCLAAFLTARKSASHIAPYTML